MELIITRWPKHIYQETFTATFGKAGCDINIAMPYTDWVAWIHFALRIFENYPNVDQC